jgi:hypothetical protein
MHQQLLTLGNGYMIRKYTHTGGLKGGYSLVQNDFRATNQQGVVLGDAPDAVSVDPWDKGHAFGVNASAHSDAYIQADYPIGNFQKEVAHAAIPVTVHLNRHTGYMDPPTPVSYSINKTKTCCSNACDSDYTVASEVDACKTGCGMWLHSSSLNWEAKTWHKPLRAKCKLDCTMPLSFRQTEAASRQTESSSYFTNKYPNPILEAECKKGCHNYYFCMDYANPPTPAPATPPPTDAPTQAPSGHDYTIANNKKFEWCQDHPNADLCASLLRHTDTNNDGDGDNDGHKDLWWKNGICKEWCGYDGEMWKGSADPKCGWQSSCAGCPECKPEADGGQPSGTSKSASTMGGERVNRNSPNTSSWGNGSSRWYHNGTDFHDYN